MKRKGTILSAILLVLVGIYIVPFLVYSISTVLIDLERSDDAPPLPFLVSILISKVGVAVAFVLLFYKARSVFTGHWILYASIWWLMYVVGEIGQAIGPDYTWKEAIAGILSETIYFPLSAYLVNRLTGLPNTNPL